MLFLSCCLLFASSNSPGTLQDGKPIALEPVPKADIWWQERHALKLAELEARRDEVQLLFVGDSITHWWEDARGLPTWRKHYAGFGAFNLGFSGDCTEHLLWRLQEGEIEGLEPRVTVVLIGTNNAGVRSEDPRDTAAGVAGVLEELKSRLPRTKILLLAILPRGVDASDELRQLTEQTNRIVAEFADGERVFFLDIGKHFLDSRGNLRPNLMPDYLHPSAEGYATWASAMGPTLKRLMMEPRDAGEEPEGDPSKGVGDRD